MSKQFAIPKEEIKQLVGPMVGCFITDRVTIGGRKIGYMYREEPDRPEDSGVTLHSYRYAWAERAKTVGMPERFAQEALGHNSKAVHRAYAKRALMKIPSLEDYEKRAALKIE